MSPKNEIFKVLAFDYRGFGDSSKVPLDEDTVVEDASLALAWLRARVGREARILVLAHSLGTAIASRALANTEAEAAPISGLVLMAAFNNFTDELVALQGRHVGVVRR